MLEDLVPLVAIISIFVVLPAMLINMRKSRTLSAEDEKLLDDMSRIADRLDARLTTLERIMADEAAHSRKET